MTLIINGKTYEAGELVAYVENLEKENKELKARVEKQNADIITLKGLTERQRLQIEALNGQTPWKNIKDKSKVVGKLTKATEIIKKLYAVYYYPCVTESDLKYRDELVAEIKQFLKNDGCLDVMCEDCTKDMKCKHKGVDYNDCPNLSYKEVNGYYETHICLLTRKTCSKYEKEINTWKNKNRIKE